MLSFMLRDDLLNRYFFHGRIVHVNTRSKRFVNKEYFETSITNYPLVSNKSDAIKEGGHIFKEG